MSAYGVFQTFYQLSLFKSKSSSDISWIGSTQSSLMFFVSLGSGPVFDAGYLDLLLWSGTLLTVAGMFLASICTAYWQSFLAQGLMMGVGFGCLYLPGAAIIAQHFRRRRAFAIGLSSTGSAVGELMQISK
jgi:MFS family permease